MRLDARKATPSGGEHSASKRTFLRMSSTTWNSGPGGLAFAPPLGLHDHQAQFARANSVSKKTKDNVKSSVEHVWSNYMGRGFLECDISSASDTEPKLRTLLLHHILASSHKVWLPLHGTENPLRGQGALPGPSQGGTRDASSKARST